MQMEPENVHPRDFTNHRVLYNNKDFSIAIGNWDDDESNVALPLLVWLLGKSGEENDSIIKEAIKQIISQKK